jgi:hypothetical protein
MAETDAIPVASKKLGVAASIFLGLWDGLKYAKSADPVDANASEIYMQNFETKVGTSISLGVLTDMYGELQNAHKENIISIAQFEKGRKSLTSRKEQLTKEAKQ